MTAVQDTLIISGPNFFQLKCGNLLVTPLGGVQTTLAAALTSTLLMPGIAAALPTSPSGLPAGSLWRNGDYLCVV